MSRNRPGWDRTDPRRSAPPPRRARPAGSVPLMRRPMAWLALGAIAVGVGALIFLGPMGGQLPSSGDPSGPDGAAVRGNGCPTSQPPALPTGEARTVNVETELGTIEIDVRADLSPIAAGNFVALASCGYYDGIVFHRVVPGFVIQGGDPTGVGNGGPGYTIQDEPVTATYERGTVAMARSRLPNSVGSQFFVVLDDAAARSLTQANNYQIIGSVTAGMETADAIAAAADAENPSDPVTMTRVTVDGPPATEETP